MNKRAKWSLWVLFLCAGVLALVVLACCPATSTTPSGGVPATKAPEKTQPATKAPEETQPAAVTPTSEEPKIVTCKVGDKCVAGGIALTVIQVTKETKLGDFFEADPGKVYLCIEVLLENEERDDDMPVNPLYFEVKDSDGYVYNTSFGSKDPSLKATDVAKGDKTRGWVTFEIPEKATGLVVTYEPLVLLGGYKSIRVDLGQ